MTQVSLELTAEATLLTRDHDLGGGMVAYAGRMQAEDIDDLRELVADDWNVSADEARIRFITLPGSGKDYMLYSRRTVDGLILSLVFSGITPLRDIRQQGKRLLDALESVPDETAQRPTVRAALPIVAPLRAEPPPDVGAYAPYACVWLLRDAHAALDDDVAQAIIAGMNTQLHEQYWRIHDLQVQGDHVYVLADIPGEAPPYSIIRDLKRRSAAIARKQNDALPDGLWADSYLVVTPGRALDDEEIQQFINFERIV
jgi:REP element-mobilizing transposase RayT